MTSAEFERCEIDKSQPHLESLQKLSAALSVEAGWLLNGDEYFATETLAQMREQTGYLRELRDMARAQAEQSRLSAAAAAD